MFKTIAATTLAATIAFTSGSTAARADNDDLARFLVGAATLAIIANSLDNNSKSRTTVHVHKRHAPHKKVVKRHAPKRVSVPGACERRLRSRSGGTWHVYGLNCVKRHGSVAALPNKCLRRIDLGSKVITAYGRQCLRQAGVRIR